jgi:gluconate 2-dehydrogenase gamma chain
MAGQNIERRDILRILALAIPASQFTGFKQWVFAHDHVNAGNIKAEAQNRPYEPRFFLPEEYALVERLSEMIIPSDGTPGAREAGASEFIDFIVASDPSIQPAFRQGLTWMNAHAMRLYNQPFLNLPAKQQTEILEHLAYRDRHRPGEQAGRAFFELFREYTVIGFYTSRVGLEQLDYPGLRHYYPDSPGCPHTDDRAHQRLTPTRV